MDVEGALNLALIAILAAAGFFVMWRARERNAHDVLMDLRAPVNGKGMVDDQAGSDKPDSKIARRRKGPESASLVFPICGALLALTLKLLFLRGGLPALVAMTVCGLAGGYLAGRRFAALKVRRRLREIEFYLPIVMERMVMAVQAGLDIIPGLHAVLDLEMKAEAGRGAESRRPAFADPVSELLWRVHQLTEAGLGFEQSLREVAASVDSSALRHAFIHLAVAQREGGEVVMPLKELSDSTQLCYQETLEEEIARMPVKATLPLLLTFAGLIICFITTPLIQVLSITGKVMGR